MSKINFENPLFKSEPTEERKGNFNPKLIREAGAQEGLTPEYTRFTSIIKVNNVNFIKSYAYTKRLTVKDTMDMIIEKFKEEYEKDPKHEELIEVRRMK